MQNSILVNVGDYIQANTSIAKCGNSGYSPVPHIHIQVQEFGLIGSFTKKFIFSEYRKGEKLLLNTLPKKDEIIHAIINDRGISSRFLFILDDTFKYEVYKDETLIDKIEFKVKMNELSEFYLRDKDNNKLYFYNDLKQFYFYNYTGNNSYLKQLFILVPRIPFINNQKISFKDYLPVYLLTTKLQSIYIELISTLRKEFYKQTKEYCFDGNTISSEFGEVSIEPQHKGFAKIEYDNIKLRRIL
jgi:murein DD-endopeptidase MepM/ murein hydrolase activator NlpD